ncbi:agamous-like MADS-box protein AGL30 isoform X3 [Beta vulgaris subsp. vulgaris]|uniref:agamous-like MADS-box protein AGL30 isoform X3 n=1 Tax=Beta vulgaris subsp. vulgaris TaxID=3555 RepID=UPI0020375BAF|nr:agamous-like MADS-box protein AGL30 isoform X3 [Beta vulgaris subsp. vulgaris]
MQANMLQSSIINLKKMIFGFQCYTKSHFSFSGMGKVKLDIKKLENSSSRQTTYSKRKHGILKKAQELSILCDIDLALVMFSPGGKPSLCCGKHSSIEEVIARLNQLPPQERTKRKLEGLEALKKTYRKKSDHAVNIEDFLDTSAPTLKDVTEQASKLQTRLAEIHERLWYWTNPDNVNDFGLLMQMEDSLEKSLDQIQRQKENFQKQHCLALVNEENFQKEHRLALENQFSFQASGGQQLQSLLWNPSDNIQQTFLTQEQKSHTQRDIESCTGSTSGSYFGCLSTSSKSEANSPGQLSGIDNVGHDAFQGLQFGGMYSYLPYGLNMQGGDSTNMQSMLGMDQRQSTALAYDAGRNYQSTLPSHGIGNHFLPDTPADSAFADYNNYQKSTVQAPAMPSIYERIAGDPSHLLFDNNPKS